ncbi:putative glutamate receptor [Araneus ventricosus]|uniref:Putative glutamate receptor n=1 Tax=Araneus ventricosus TaxID=182803 RepID=A0A4Y2HHP0_ARAVE|nr:putative glutamate receptor [Araneus ventricosus]
MKQKSLLKVAAMTSPYIFGTKKESVRNPELTGYEGKYLQLILNVLDVDFELIRPPDNEIGRKTTDGNWTGLIGMVQRGEADFSLGSLFMTNQRNEAVSFSTPYTVTGVTFVLRKPRYEFSNFAYVYPFDVLTWLLILFSLVIISALFFVIIRQKISFSRIFLATYGSIINQPMILPKEQKNWNWLFGLWLLFVAVLSLCYTVCLLSFLSIPFEKNTITTFQQLSVAVQKGTHRVLPPKGSFIIDYLATSEVDYLRIIGREIIRNNWYFDVTDMLSTVTSRRDIVHLDSRHELEFYFAGHKFWGDYIISSEDIGVSPIGFALRKNCSFAEKLNSIISRTRDAGLFEKFMKNESLKLRMDVSDVLAESKTPKQLSINNLMGVFLISLIGISCSIVVLIFEIIFYNFSKCKRIMKSEM